jgi:hypothetical protein
VSFEYLKLLYHQRYSMISSLKEVQLLEEPAEILIYRQLVRINDELSELVDKSEQWLWKEDNVSSKTTYRVIEMLEVIS